MDGEGALGRRGRSGEDDSPRGRFRRRLRSGRGRVRAKKRWTSSGRGSVGSASVARPAWSTHLPHRGTAEMVEVADLVARCRLALAPRAAVVLQRDLDDHGPCGASRFPEHDGRLGHVLEDVAEDRQVERVVRRQGRARRRRPTRRRLAVARRGAPRPRSARSRSASSRSPLRELAESAPSPQPISAMRGSADRTRRAAGSSTWSALPRARAPATPRTRGVSPSAA